MFILIRGLPSGPAVTETDGIKRFTKNDSYKNSLTIFILIRAPCSEPAVTETDGLTLTRNDSGKKIHTKKDSSLTSYEGARHN